MVHSNWNLVWEADALKRLGLSLTFDTVITGRNDVVPYWEA